jgi:hypothetical protein
MWYTLEFSSDTVTIYFGDDAEVITLSGEDWVVSSSPAPSSISSPPPTQPSSEEISSKLDEIRTTMTDMMRIIPTLSTAPQPPPITTSTTDFPHILLRVLMLIQSHHY